MGHTTRETRRFLTIGEDGRRRWVIERATFPPGTTFGDPLAPPVAEGTDYRTEADEPVEVLPDGSYRLAASGAILRPT